jgi:mannose-6-phosphate isomerase class I
MTDESSSESTLSVSGYVGPKEVVPITPAVFDYAWGIRGLDSRVARYALESGSLETVDPAAPYAELWIGTHPKVYLS